MDPPVRADACSFRHRILERQTSVAVAHAKQRHKCGRRANGFFSARASRIAARVHGFCLPPCGLDAAARANPHARCAGCICAEQIPPMRISIATKHGPAMLKNAPAKAARFLSAASIFFCAV
jgi:hypothetical protein